MTPYFISQQQPEEVDLPPLPSCPTDSVNPSDNSDTSGRTGQTQPLTDEEREAAAYRAGCAMQSWYSQYQHTGDPDHLDCAYHWLGVMRGLLAGRSAEFVARLEKQRGLT